MLKLYHIGNRFQNLGAQKFIGDLRAGANQKELNPKPDSNTKLHHD